MARNEGNDDRLLNPAETEAGPSAASRRDAAKARHMSLSQVAAALDRDRNTVAKWLTQGCPAVEKADRDTGKQWVLDIAEVVRWLERRSAETTAEKLGGGADGLVSEAEGKRRKAVAQAIIYEAEALEVLQSVARYSVIVDRVAADYAEIRSRLTAIGEAVAGRVPRSVAGQCKKIVDEQVANSLAALRVDRELSQGAATQEA